MRFRKAVQWSHSIIREVLGPGDVAVDATAGNGHDTLFLCRLTGPDGHVHGIDIQEQAIEATRRRLTDNGVTPWSFSLTCGSHSNLSDLIPGSHRPKVRAIMFNFGYLPGGDHDLTTREETSVAAVSQAMDLLAPGGRMTLTFYTGHPGGPEEAAAVRRLLEQSDPSIWVVLEYRFINLPNNPPYVVALERSAGCD